MLLVLALFFFLYICCTSQRKLSNIADKQKLSTAKGYHYKKLKGIIFLKKRLVSVFLSLCMILVWLVITIQRGNLFRVKTLHTLWVAFAILKLWKLNAYVFCNRQSRTWRPETVWYEGKMQMEFLTRHLKFRKVEITGWGSKTIRGRQLKLLDLWGIDIAI